MNVYSAQVTDNRTGETLIITSDYANYKEFKADLRGNGFAVNSVWLVSGTDKALTDMLDIRNKANELGVTIRAYKKLYKND